MSQRTPTIPATGAAPPPHDQAALWALQEAMRVSPVAGECPAEDIPEAALYADVFAALEREPFPPEPMGLAGRIAAEARRVEAAHAQVARFARHLWGLLLCLYLPAILIGLASTGSLIDLFAWGQASSAHEALPQWVTVVALLALASTACETVLHMRRESRPF